MNDTVVVGKFNRNTVAIPVLPDEQIAHAMHALALTEAAEYLALLSLCLNQNMGMMRRNKLIEGRARLDKMAVRLDDLIAAHEKIAAKPG